MGSRTGMAATALVAVALACCTLAAPAALGAPREFYGVNSAETPSASEFNRMGSGGVGTLRMNLAWGTVQTGPEKAYDWGLYDSIIGHAAENGIRLLPVIYSSPGWLAPSYEHPPPNAALKRWRSFVRAAAARYGNGGAFWALNPQVPRIPVTHWQIWNEPNSPQFWKPRPNAKRYVRLLRVARGGIRAADPRASIVLAGLFPTPGTSLGVFISRYLPQLYRAKARGLFDAVAIHPYNVRPRDTIKDLVKVRRIMSRFRDRRTPLWVTEIGWASQGQRTPLTVSPGRQAAYLRQAFTLADRNRKRLKIRRVVWYSLRDVGSSVWYENTGLFTRDGSPKPSWGAFTGLTGGR
jgi:polysaccharide biosynthesis protein PslG